MYNKKNEFGSCAESELYYEKCRRLEVVARKVQKELRKKEKPIIKEKDIFINWTEKKRKRRNINQIF